MKRITPEQVVEAYKLTGLRPMQRDWFNIDGCGCGISAMAWNAGVKDKHPMHWADDVYGKEYVDGFTQGFDDREINFDMNETAYNDGCAAWRACIEAGLVEGEST